VGTSQPKTETISVVQQSSPNQYAEQDQPLQKQVEPSKEVISQSTSLPRTERKSGYGWLIVVSGLVVLWIVLRSKKHEKLLKNEQHLLDTTTHENKKKYAELLQREQELVAKGKKYAELLQREQELVAKGDKARALREKAEQNQIKMGKVQELRRQRVQQENMLHESENARKYQEFKIKMRLKKDEQTIPGATKKFKELFGKSMEEVIYLQKYVMEEILATENKEFVEREVNKALAKEEPNKVPEQFLTDMQQIDNMSGKEFEDFLEKMFTNLKYNVTRKKQTRDGGVDLVLENAEGITVVQAKRYKITTPVGIDAVQAVAANRRTHNAKQVMVVTTSSKFTTDAQKLASSEGVELVNRTRLKELILQAKLIKNG
jgi:HJR/Mrr/RecB family endonuclease